DKAVKEHSYVLAFHGYHDIVEHTIVGGTDTGGAKAIVRALVNKGFSAELVSPSHRLAGGNPENINNQCQAGQSIQLEISTPQREAFFSEFGLWTRASSKNKTFRAYVSAVKEVLDMRYK
ncbi:poly-gamma-glutamate hydrolase family protein, partial [Bacillus haynesii]|nr:poly-gamma-glutamate hydrolase family protein [Bacillus haynesii]